MNLHAIITAIQLEITRKSRTPLSVDGTAGPETWKAIYFLLFGKAWVEDIEGVPVDQVDERSEKAIATLQLPVREYARALVRAAQKQGIKIVITSGSRTYEEQDALYQQGRSKPGKIVTNSPAGYSNHNFGIAFDVTIFNGKDPVWESPLYKVVGSIGKSIGLTWGGDWVRIQDEPHFELHPKWAAGMTEAMMLSSLRGRHANGEGVFS